MSRKSVKLTDNSLLTVADQLRLYQEQMGDEAALRQIRLSRQARGLCICNPRRVKIEGGYAHKETRVVHERGCPRFKPWMADV